MYKDCGCCGKHFYISPIVDLREYLYKHKLGKNWDTLTYYCSYTCWRKAVPEGRRKYKCM